jgi:hypothetical protein
MPYLPIAPAQDDRRQKQGASPITLLNCLVRLTPELSAKAGRSPYFIAPAPGRTLAFTAEANVRGIFSRKGCRNGNLFVAAGSSLVELSSNYSSTTIGTINGGDMVTMRADRSDLAILSSGVLRRWNGTTLAGISDVDAPTNAETLAIVARRWVAAFSDNDAFGWSVAGDYSDWPANNQAQDQDMPDMIVGQEEIAGDLWSFNAETTQVWQATGGAEESAFAKVQGVSIPFGLAGRHAIAAFGGGAMLLAHTRQVMGTSGYDLQPVAYPDLESTLKDLTEAELADCAAWSYRAPGKWFWALNAGLEIGYVFDGETGLWHGRTKYGSDEYDLDFATSAFGRVFVAGRQSRKVWVLDDNVYTDDGDPILREMTVHIPSQGDVPVDKLVFDLVTRDVPVTGQGSSPVMQVRTSSDNGEVWSDWRELALPTPSNKFRVQDFAFGVASAEHGMLVHMRISDPIGFAFHGVWINPSEQEMNAA